METEILVHVSAPSGHDACYRAQITAILGFQSASRQLVMGGADACDLSDRPGDDRATTSSAEAEVISLTSASIPSASVHAREQPNSGEELRGASSTLSSSDDHQGHHPRGPAQYVPPSCHRPPIRSAPDDSLGSLISVIPDSQPEELPGLQSAVPPPQPQPPMAEHSSPSNQRSPVPKRRCVEPPSCFQGNNDDAEGAAQTESSLSTTKKKKHSPLHQTGRSEDSSCRDPPRSPLRGALTPTTATSPANCMPLTNPLPLQLHPPPPPIATAQFTTHITATLSMLADRLKPARTYKPVRQARALDTLERGHWVLHINVLDEADEHNHHHHAQKGSSRCSRNDWPASTLQRFWTFLSDFIARDGRAGWGVWCVLEQTPSPHDADSIPCLEIGDGGDDDDDGHHPPPLSTPVTLKMYAWGEVAMHVYLLLFLASERRVKGMGARWRDAREETVIVMP